MASYLESNNKDIKVLKEKVLIVIENHRVNVEQILEIKQALGEEKDERHKLLEVRYNDIAKIENRIAQLVENEMRVYQYSL